jgi:hypothetical protein
VEAENTRPPVGQPIHERALLDAFSAQGWKALSPGPGRSLFLIPEADIGLGRPDFLLVACAPSAVARHLKVELPVVSPAWARAAFAGVPSDVGLSDSYVRDVRGWLRRNRVSRRYLESRASLVADSIAIEAKVSDWGRALQQVAKFRVFAHRSAVLMPDRAVSRIPRERADRYGIGILEERKGRINWSVPAVSHELDGATRLWLAEILIRALRAGRAYRLSADLKSRSASRKAATLGR